MKISNFLALVDVKARMSLKSDASKLYLSYLWWLLEPVLWVLMFYLVFTLLLGFGRDLLFLMAGKIPFLWFSKSVLSSSNSIVQGKSLITQTNVPRQFFPYEQVHTVLYRQWVTFLMLFGLTVVYGYMPSWHWLWMVPLWVVQYMLILLVSLVAAICVSYVRDTRILIGMSMMGLMFGSGIFWDLERIQDPVSRELLVTWNPLAYLLDAYRDVLMRGELYDLHHLGWLALILAVGLVLVHLFYRYMGQSMASRVINS
ncbi:ABC transporter permease [Marinimicrobium sp. LS-A18]|uniref:ABC transporter permease n=1 Tax=Marinimicrobium sp. LS-A18 TaxID=1381596 RepID=UPI000464D2B1|nr:ABC transporter permease [Marinimicrobium sp. LS-A18]